VAQPEQDVLIERLGRYPVRRYPVQHANTQFHLGWVLLDSGDTTAAAVALTVAVQEFGRAGMRLESAKATMMLGIARRIAGRAAEASAAFESAADDFRVTGQVAEQAAASYNQGLACQDRGDRQGAHDAWVAARELFVAAGLPAQAAAAARDYGGSLLTGGEPLAAVAELTYAVGLGQQATDPIGIGAAGNALGLAHLAAGDPGAAVAALREALAWVPRSVRPADHAMIKANLAVAYEQAGELARARLAAGQALALTGAAAPVRQQARRLLSGLPGPAHAAMLAVLDGEPPDRWVPDLREEVLRLADAPVAERNRELSGLLDGVLGRPGTCYDLAEALLSVVLELPPAGYAIVVVALVDSTGSRPRPDVERLQGVLGSAMARFPLPQWQRIAASLNAAAVAAGQPATWR